MNIVIANSVGIDQKGFHIVHVPSRWSLGVRNFTNCGYYPWELAYTSSLLKRETPHRVRFLDGILNGWDVDTYFTQIEQEAPDWLVMESSSRTIGEDLRLARKVKKAFGTRLIFTGQHPMAQPEEVLQVADHVCTGEYEYAVLDLVQGKDPRAIPGVYPNSRPDLLDVNALPFPEDDDVRRIDYHEPNCVYRQIQMYASRGCPRRCNFCAAATLYYDELNWRPRKVREVVREIAYLKNKYPEMEGVFFDEEVHNIRPRFNIDLARTIRAEGLDGLRYEAMCEYASLDPRAMVEMKQAGYYKIRVGVETGSDVVAERMTLGRKHDLGKLRAMLEAGKDAGLMFYATFSMGGLGSSEVEDGKTVDLIADLSRRGLLDEIQVSINTPQPGTDFFKSAQAEGLLRPVSDWAEYDGNGHVVVEYPHYRADRIRAMFQSALTAFDRGREAARSREMKASLQTSLNAIPKSSKVLVLRCVRPWMISILLEALVGFRGIRADVLGQESVADEIRRHPAVGRFFTYGNGFFSTENISAQLGARLRDECYDVILTPLANHHLNGYQNVLEVARMLKPRALLGVFPDGRIQALE